MLISHARFLGNVSTSAANKLVDTFVEATNNLAIMPERNPWLEHDMVPFQKYRKVLFGNYNIALYQIQGNIVYVTAVLDCRLDYGWLL